MPVDMPFEDILHTTLNLEGGETWDTGGHTNYGITQATYDAVAPTLGLPPKNVKDLNYGEVRKVYENEYYRKPKIDRLPTDRLQGIMFDWGVNAGTGTAIKKLQEIVGTKPDGIMGKKTLKAVNEYIAQKGENTLYFDIMGERVNHYNNLIASNPVKYGEYEQGWMNRINKLADKYNGF